MIWSIKFNRKQNRKNKDGTTLKKITMAVILLLLVSSNARTQEMAITAQNQFLLFSKILTFERQLRERVGDEIVIGLVYQKKFRSSLNAKIEFEKALNESSIKKINEIEIRYQSINLSENTDLADFILQNHIDVLYITPVRAFDPKSIALVAQTNQVLTMSGVAEYIEAGIAVCVGIKSDKPQILINLQVVKSIGIDFSSQLLKLAKVIQ